MPNDALIGALDQLRESYNLRLKATNNLLGLLKSTPGLLSKISKSLNDYAHQSSPASSGTIANAQQILAGLRLKDEVVDPLAPDLRREVKALTSVSTALKDALAALRGEAVDVVRLGRAYNVLQANRTQNIELETVLPGVEGELEQAQASLSTTFGETLRDAVVARGMTLGGRPPRFALGRFDINVNWVTRSAALSYGTELLVGRVPLSVDALLKTYDREVKVIMGRNENGERWIEQLYQAWDTVRKKRATTDKRVNIVDCYLELVLLRQPRAFRSAPSKRTIVDYTRAQFVFDFFEFTNEQRLAYNNLYVAASNSTKSQTDNPEKSFFIVEGSSPGDGRYISDIEFKA
ncbi:MAG: hypothetical protein H0X37_02650 [Herpetosiphonaceae bacterium]|nr:hypothetical protein [Herpetosiphonaceae bacterium]